VLTGEDGRLAAGFAREGRSRRWLALVAVAFCLPLFVGLGRPDVGNDEAIYSYAVDSILETGHWLSPLNSPSNTDAFLEKPPLKFWIVALPIRLGLLPHDEFGLRFWDALFGGVAFVYVFLIGRRLAGPLCGATAVLVLFAQNRLLFDHGLRSNTMEAPLFLSYCGGVYHYLRYGDPETPHHGRHLAAVAALFFLGFMTKFVAVLFLPLVLGAATLVVPEYRRQVLRDWWRWALAGAAVAAGVLPWFVYQDVVTDGGILRTMFGDQVYTRFTAYTDPAHLQPWHFYFTQTFVQLQRSGCTVLVGLGFLALGLATIRYRLRIGLVLLLWLVVPLTLMSAGSSKLYHYAYPYLPPLALAAGYGVAWIASRMEPALRAALGRAVVLAPRPSSALTRGVLVAVACAAAALAVVTAAHGQVRVALGSHVLFSNASVLRPLIVVALCAVLSGAFVGVVSGAAVLAITLVVPLPLTGYLKNIKELTSERHPLRSLSTCLQQADATRRAANERVRGTLGPSTADEVFLHQYFYYLRHAGGWEERQPEDDEALARALFVRGEERPVAINGRHYAESLERHPAAGPLPRGVRIGGILVLLPGPYAPCAAAVPEGTY
jgi:4-amino-4-deoxy-L-arabinose transferase-like glycosyltransferase